MLRVHTVLSGWTGGPGLNTFYFSGPGAGSSAEATEAVARVHAFWTAMASGFASVTTLQVQGQVDEIDPTDGSLSGSFAVTPPSAVTGTGSPDLGDKHSMLLLTLLTGTFHGGRRVSGRSYIGPLSDGQTAGGVLVPAMTSLATSSAPTLGTLITTVIANVMWRRPKPGDPGAAVTVSGYSTTSKIAVLRSRRD